jgi:DNA-binding MarR family transcriptional regulator
MNSPETTIPTTAETCSRVPRAWSGLVRAHERLMHELDGELQRTHDISLAEFDVLLQLSEAPERRMRMADLADAVLLTRSGVSRLVDRLESRGLVERSRCPSDARGLNASLTDAGSALLAEAAVTHLAGVRTRLIDRLAPEDVARLESIWEQLGA